MTIASSFSQMSALYSFPAFSTFVILLFILVKHIRRSKASTSIHKLPPGPPKLPIIGNLHQLVGASPHHVITNLANKYGPVMHLQIGEVFGVVISSAEAAKEVLKTKEQIFAQRPVPLAVEITSYDHSSLIFAPYGDYWRKMRKICVNELLNAKHVQSFRSIREEEVWCLIENVSSQEEIAINLSEKIFLAASNVISRAAFSKKYDDQGDLKSLISEVLVAGGGFNLPDLYPSIRILRYITGAKPALERMKKRMDKILDDIIREHKVKRKLESFSSDGPDHEDVLDLLLNLQESNELDIHITDNIIKSLTWDILIAGSDNAAMTIEWAMSELIKNPRVMEKAQAEVREAFKGKTKIKEVDIQNLDFLQLVIKETMRMHIPGALLPREAREKCEINGYEIPAKAKVIINAWGIARDPNTWTEPDCFKPERFQDSDVDFRGTNFELLPFGAGRRICPGITFATANIELALAQLLYHFDWKLPDGIKPEELDMTEIFGITTTKKQNLHLVPTICVPFGG